MVSQSLQKHGSDIVYLQKTKPKIAFSCSVPARISKGQGAGPEKGLFSALLDFQKRHFLGNRYETKHA
jgi:hypothetical protein